MPRKHIVAPVSDGVSFSNDTMTSGCQQTTEVNQQLGRARERLCLPVCHLAFRLDGEFKTILSSGVITMPRRTRVGLRLGFKTKFSMTTRLMLSLRCLRDQAVRTSIAKAETLGAAHSC